MSIFRKTKGTG